jgi:hypothetical protein
MIDRTPPTWERVLQLARRIADGEVGEPGLTAESLAALVLEFQEHVVLGRDTPAASTRRLAMGVGRVRLR